MTSSLALSRPLVLEDGRCLRTLADAGELVLSLDPEEQAQPRWQAVASELIGEIRNGRPDHVPAITDRIARALSESPLGSVRLVDSAAPPKPAVASMPAAASMLAAAAPVVALPVVASPPAAPMGAAPVASITSRYALTASSEFLSILAVILTIALGVV